MSLAVGLSEVSDLQYPIVILVNQVVYVVCGNYPLGCLTIPVILFGRSCFQRRNQQVSSQIFSGTSENLILLGEQESKAPRQDH